MKRSQHSGSIWVFAGCAAIYIYAISTGENDIVNVAWAALAFQIGCWALAWIFLLYRSPGGYLRLSDPAVLVMLWCGVYLIYPSIVWMQGQTIRYGYEIALKTGVLLFWLHGLFILAFVTGYLLVVKRSRWTFPKMDPSFLPSGWLFYLLPFLPMICSIFARLFGGGGLLPQSTYGDAWYGAHENIRAARTTGGLSYLWVQISSKVWFYPILMQGVGAGLILVHSIRVHKKHFYPFLLLFSGMIFLLLFGSGGRSAVIIILLIGLIFADFLVGPLPYRGLFFAFFAVVILFEFFGYYRAYRYLGGYGAMGISLEIMADAFKGLPNLTEFSSMLSKESLSIDLFCNTKEGVRYLLRPILDLVPSQLMPGKLSFESTGDLLSLRFLNDQAIAGAGVAGTIIGDGYRFAGVLGIPVYGVILGAILALTQNWLTKEVRLGKGPILLRVALIAGFYGWAFNVLRGDLRTIISTMFYNVGILWVIFAIVFPGKWCRFWIKPLPIVQSKRS